MIKLSLYEIIVLAFGLSMDAFSVSITNGMAMKKVRFKAAFIIAAAFGIFQGIMPLIGYALSFKFAGYFETFSKPISFGLLCFIGGKMIYEAFKRSSHDNDETVEKHLSLQQLLALAIATSIDALAVGVAFATVNLSVSIWIACLVIALVTFATCLPGVYLGKKFGDLLGDKGEILGGIILIIIAVKIAFF